MSSCARVVAVVALAACGRHAPTARERALAQLPAGARVVAVAHGTALATPVIRHAVDLARGHVPTEMGCVIDAALAADGEVAVAESPSGVTIAISSTAAITTCPALALVAPGLYVAAIGEGALARDRTGSVLGDPRWSRAAPYLASAPVVLAANLDGRHVVAAAQPSPVDAWVAIDAADADVVEHEVRSALHRYHALDAAESAGKLVVTRERDQIVVRSAKLEGDDLAVLVGDALRALEAYTRPPRPVPACPAASDLVVRCTDATHVVVRSLGRALIAATSTASDPVVESGEVIGLRVTTDAPLVLRRGDLLLGIDAHRITTGGELAQVLRTLHRRAVLAVRRDGADLVLELSEP